ERLQMGQDVNPRDVLKLLLLGPPFDAGMASQVQRTLALAPTFVLLWIGNEDVLELVRRPDAAAGQLTPAEFGRRFRRLLEGLATPLRRSLLPRCSSGSRRRASIWTAMGCRS